MSDESPGLLRSVLAGFSEGPVLALGATQTLAYGSLFYAYGVLAPTIARDFNIGLDAFFGIFSVGLLLGGFAAPLVGRLLDAHGARVVMAGGSLGATVALLFCAWAPSLPVFGVSIILMEIATCFVVYESAFAGLTQIHRHNARQRITSITLIAGFASTIFWPLTLWLEGRFGWRGTLLLFALGHLVIAAPLHWFVLKAAKPLASAGPGDAASPPDAPSLQGAARQRAVLFYTIVICVSGLAYASIPVHMLRIIENEGFPAETAALIAMVMGPAQVASRIVEMAFGQRFDALVTGRIALGTLTACLLILLVGSGSPVVAVVFAALYGVSQGLITIARGTVPLLLFGPNGYATLVGRVTGLRFFVNAGAPVAFATIATHLGMGTAVATLAALAGIAFLTFLRLQRPDPSL